MLFFLLIIERYATFFSPLVKEILVISLSFLGGSNEGARWHWNRVPFYHPTSSFPPPPLFLPFSLCPGSNSVIPFKAELEEKSHYFLSIFLLLLQVMTELGLIEWMIERIFDLIPFKAKLEEKSHYFLSIFLLLLQRIKKKNSTS